jgi:hypothetical protein
MLGLVATLVLVRGLRDIQLLRQDNECAQVIGVNLGDTTGMPFREFGATRSFVLAFPRE